MMRLVGKVNASGSLGVRGQRERGGNCRNDKSQAQQDRVRSHTLSVGRIDFGARLRSIAEVRGQIADCRSENLNHRWHGDKLGTMSGGMWWCLRWAGNSIAIFR